MYECTYTITFRCEWWTRGIVDSDKTAATLYQLHLQVGACYGRDKEEQRLVTGRTRLRLLTEVQVCRTVGHVLHGFAHRLGQV